MKLIIGGIALIAVAASGLFQASLWAGQKDAEVISRPNSIDGAAGSTDSAAKVWVDPMTGCHYIAKTGSGGSYTPRLGSNGAPYCRPAL